MIAAALGSTWWRHQGGLLLARFEHMAIWCVPLGTNDRASVVPVIVRIADTRAIQFVILSVCLPVFCEGALSG